MSLKRPRTPPESTTTTSVLSKAIVTDSLQLPKDPKSLFTATKVRKNDLGFEFGVNDVVSEKGTNLNTATGYPPSLAHEALDGGSCGATKRLLLNDKPLSIHPFLDTIVKAFNYHLPLLLRPEDFWTLIVQGVSEHVKANAEALRERWVLHKEGKQEIVVIRDEFVLGEANPWVGVLPDFISQIREKTVPGVVDTLRPEFSTTTDLDTVISSIATMDVLKSYFHFVVLTRCGFPRITLAGTDEDWKRLVMKADALISEKCLPDFAETWLESLHSVLDKIVAHTSENAEVDVAFWQSFCKRGGSRGSGGYSWVNGWFNVFLPFLTGSKPNRWCKPYSADQGYVKEGAKECYYDFNSTCSGPDMRHLPNGLCAVPVEWQYLGTSIPLQFKAGFAGVAVDPSRGHELSAEMGWVITKA